MRQELEWGLAQYLGQGNVPCYRGPTVLDSSPAVRDLWAHYVSLFKAHRRVLNADVIHVQRPNGR